MGSRRKRGSPRHSARRGLHQARNNSNGDPDGRACFTTLPPDLHLQLMSHLDYRTLQMLRATNSYFRNLPTATEIERARKAYVQTLLAQEVDEVRRSSRTGGRNGAHGNNNNNSSSSSSSKENDFSNEFLCCYTCFRRRDITHFANTQVTRRRGKGHADAHKRFCCDCAVRHRKWESGIIVSLPNRRNEIYCRRCMTMQQLPRNTTLWSFGLCEGCRVRTGVADVSPTSNGASSLVWHETSQLFRDLYYRYRNGRKRVPAAVWKDLEENLARIRADQELLESPAFLSVMNYIFKLRAQRRRFRRSLSPSRPVLKKLILR